MFKGKNRVGGLTLPDVYEATVIGSRGIGEIKGGATEQNREPRHRPA